jgi:hypothetical protein
MRQLTTCSDLLSNLFVQIDSWWHLIVCVCYRWGVENFDTHYSTRPMRQAVSYLPSERPENTEFCLYFSHLLTSAHWRLACFTNLS